MTDLDHTPSGAGPDQPIAAAARPIVGIGASAGGLESLKQFFHAMSADSGAGFVVAQHLQHGPESMMRELIAGFTAMPVNDIRHGATVAANTVHVLPPDRLVTIERGVLRLEIWTGGLPQRAPIDEFFRALAADQGRNAVAIVMSGAGSDGTLGVRAIKDHGGLALAEHMEPDRASEGFVSMPQSAWATGVVDFSVPAHDMPEHITNYAAYLRDLLDSRGVEKAESEASNEELQSSKEETQSINDALDRKVAQLNQLDDDLNNLLEATDLATIFLDGDMRIKWFAPAARRIFRLIQTDVGRPITDITAGFDATGLTDELHDVLTSHGTRERPITLPNDGQTYTMRIRPYWSSGGEVNGVIMTFQDITGLTNATHRQQLLVAALQHRVRNILSTVRSLARESRETSDDLDTFFERFDGRLTALATSESIVTRSGDGRVDLAELVHEAMPDALVDGAAFNVSGDSVMLGARTAQMIALALNELATNAIKFGALGEAHGTVDLSWTTRSRGGETWLHLVWHETGIAATGEQPGAHGFGLDLVENGIPYELGGTGTVRFEPGALTCTLEVPIDRGHGDGITIANGSAPE